MTMVTNMPIVTTEAKVTEVPKVCYRGNGAIKLGYFSSKNLRCLKRYPKTRSYPICSVIHISVRRVHDFYITKLDKACNSGTFLIFRLTVVLGLL